MKDHTPSKKDFANMINQLVGEKVMTERKLDLLLEQAKKSYEQQGVNGLFDYMREVTQAPVDNQQMKLLMDTMIQSGEPSRAFDRLSQQQWLSPKMIKELEKGLSPQSHTGRRNRKKK
ncbi:hypothetical protein GCM10011571_21200 [Marinithermofilum abyssi]|uniref:Uncharacterized protein n=1 Tax=Marinithermofilum abyssi TaxID=1571185 RepID=A0A8J2VHX2_9BACL|nr:hypothetical protein [Marinithermofilum abyssi]GGE19046.1 hypothetical protein GCM10011571_21200 [Marinithermofilum abyssi]